MFRKYGIESNKLVAFFNKTYTGENEKELDNDLADSGSSRFLSAFDTTGFSSAFQNVTDGLTQFREDLQGVRVDSKSISEEKKRLEETRKRNEREKKKR